MKQRHERGGRDTTTLQTAGEFLLSGNKFTVLYILELWKETLNTFYESVNIKTH